VQTCSAPLQACASSLQSCSPPGPGCSPGVQGCSEPGQVRQAPAQPIPAPNMELSCRPARSHAPTVQRKFADSSKRHPGGQLQRFVMDQHSIYDVSFWFLQFIIFSIPYSLATYSFLMSIMVKSSSTMTWRPGFTCSLLYIKPFPSGMYPLRAYILWAGP